MSLDIISSKHIAKTDIKLRCKPLRKGKRFVASKESCQHAFTGKFICPTVIQFLHSVDAGLGLLFTSIRQVTRVNSCRLIFGPLMILAYFALSLLLLMSACHHFYRWFIISSIGCIFSPHLTNFGMKHCVVDRCKKWTNHSQSVKNGPALEITWFYMDICRKMFKKYSCLVCRII